jgi:hypothetical protein
MVLNLSISADAEAKLRAKAAAAGTDLATYATRYLERMATEPCSVIALSGAVGEQFTQTGMSEEALAEFLEEEKHQMRAERRSQAQQ